MAIWAFWMFVATAAAVFLTGLGIFLIWRTLVHTRRAADHAQTMAVEAVNATRAAIEAAEAGREANEIARDTSKRQLRAYLGVECCIIDEVEDGFVLSARLRNSGQTPAYDVRIYGESFGAEYPLAEDRAFLPVEDGYSAPVDPKHTLGCVYRIFCDDREDTMRRVLAGEAGLYIQGICQYRDAFGEDHETRFRYVFGGRIANTGGLVMHAAETGNSAN